MASLDATAPRWSASSSSSTSRPTPGIQKQLSDLWAGFDDVANHPADMASRTQLLERAGTLAATFNTISRQLTQQRADTIERARRDRSRDQRARPPRSHSSTRRSRRTRSPTSRSTTSKDQRDLLANKLAELSGATIRGGDFGRCNVVLNGTALVQEDHSADIQLDTSGANVVFRWARDNSLATVTSGKAGGQLEAVNVTIPGYIAKPRRGRDVASRPGEPRCTVRSPARSRSQTRTRARPGNLQFDARRSTAARSRRRRSPAPTGRARAAQPRCRPRSRRRSTPQSAPATRP